MPVGKFVVGSEAVPVDYEFAGSMVGPKTGRMTLMQTPSLGLSTVILQLLGGDLITESGQAHRIELTRSDNGLSAEFDVLPPHSR